MKKLLFVFLLVYNFSYCQLFKTTFGGDLNTDLGNSTWSIHVQSPNEGTIIQTGSENSGSDGTGSALVNADLASSPGNK